MHDRTGEVPGFRRARGCSGRRSLQNDVLRDARRLLGVPTRPGRPLAERLVIAQLGERLEGGGNLFLARGDLHRQLRSHVPKVTDIRRRSGRIMMITIGQALRHATPLPDLPGTHHALDLSERGNERHDSTAARRAGTAPAAVTPAEHGSIGSHAGER
jgi:hypothetical protein